MSKKFSLDLSKAEPYLVEDEIIQMEPMLRDAHNILHNKTGMGNDFLGWLDLPNNYDKEEFFRIVKAAEKIKSDSEVLIVIGIGGSYLGARAVIDMLSNSFYNNLTKDKRKTPEIYFAGNNISAAYLSDLLNIVQHRDVSINVISKSGTTTEPAIAFRVFKEFMEKKYGKDNAKHRIYATTDKCRGALKSLADKEGYESFVIPDDVGGRYSVLTAVGLLPIAVAGINIDEIMEGAKASYIDCMNEDLSENHCYRYAAARNILYKKDKTIEIMANFEPSVHYFGEWWKQLYGESEGKDKKGIFPATADFSTDLHSMGQYIQDGLRNIFETHINIIKPGLEIFIESSEEDADGLNFLAGKTMDFVNKQAFRGTVLAHNDGGVPSIILNIEEMNAFNVGYMIFFFEKACAISGYLLKVNPFNQPGVEAYKKNMFALLGKPGYEKLREELQERIN